MARREMTENEEEDLQGYACPAVPNPVNAPGWARRKTCDECRQNVGYMGANFAVPLGTPVLCGPCVANPEVREKWESAPPPKPKHCRHGRRTGYCGPCDVEENEKR